MKELNSFIEKTDKELRKIELIQRARKKGKEKIENIGYVYVLSNKAYPKIYKIGSTYGLPEERAEELTGTGHLMPFKVEAQIKIRSAEYYEKKIHSILGNYRVKQNREFLLDLPTSTFCDWQKLRVQENSSDVPPGCMPRSMDVIVRNEMVERCKAGDSVVIIWI